MAKLLKEMIDLCRFLRTPKIDRMIVFYAEHGDYFPYFEGLIKELIGEHGQVLCYVTSDPNDSILQKTNPRIKVFYFKTLLPLFMALVNCKVLVMTMTDLNLFHIRRSVFPVHYVYLFHSPISTHMVYRQGAFDYYDSILCVGPHQVEEIRRYEELYKLAPKQLVEVGYPRIDKIYRESKEYKREGTPTVLIAPTWGTPNLYDICGAELIKTLLKEGYKITLGFHPEIVKKNRHFAYDGVDVETSLLSADIIAKADILITNWSGVSLEYAFGTGRPVIFIDTPPKIRNPKYLELGIEPVEYSLRSKIGKIVSPNNLIGIPQVINDFLTSRESYKTILSEMRDTYVFNFGRSSKIGADYILGLL